jgi:hypothetical protein
MVKRTIKTEAEEGIMKAFGRLIGSIGGIVVSCGVFLKDLGNFVIALYGLGTYLWVIAWVIA